MLFIIRCLTLLNRSASLLDPGMLVNIQQPLIRDDGTVLLAADSKVLLAHFSSKISINLFRLLYLLHRVSNSCCTWEDKIVISVKNSMNGYNKLINRIVVSFGKHISAKGQPQVVLNMMSHLGLGLIIRVGFKDNWEPLFFLAFRKKEKVHRGKGSKRLKMRRKLYMIY